MDAFNENRETRPCLMRISPVDSIDTESCSHDSCKFVRSLPKFDISSIPDKEGKCNICQEIYDTGDHEEDALQLPCGHHFGE